MCQHAGDFAQFLRALFGDLDQAGAFLEVVSAQRRGEAGGAAGGQDMVGAGAVVAEAFAGVASHENRAGVADFFSPTLADSQPTVLSALEKYSWRFRRLRSKSLAKIIAPRLPMKLQ